MDNFILASYSYAGKWQMDKSQIGKHTYIEVGWRVNQTNNQIKLVKLIHFKEDGLPFKYILMLHTRALKWHIAYSYTFISLAEIDKVKF